MAAVVVRVTDCRCMLLAIFSEGEVVPPMQAQGHTNAVAGTGVGTASKVTFGCKADNILRPAAGADLQLCYLVLLSTFPQQLSACLHSGPQRLSL